MILNRISSAMVVPAAARDRERGARRRSGSTRSRSPSSSRRTSSSSRRSPARRRCSSRTRSWRRRSSRRSSLRDRFQRLVAPNVAEQMISGKLEVKKGGQLRPGAARLQQRHPRLHRDERGNVRRDARRDAQRVLRADGGDDLQVRGHARQVHGRRDHGLLGRARSCTATTPSAACSARSTRWRCSAASTASASPRTRPPLAVGIGIHTGPGVVGYVGSSKALSYTVIGDTANTSARLCSSAALAGQIVISEATLSTLGGRFEFEEIEPRSLKGKEKPMRRFNVLREKPSAVARVGGDRLGTGRRAGHACRPRRATSSPSRSPSSSSSPECASCASSPRTDRRPRARATAPRGQGHQARA